MASIGGVSPVASFLSAEKNEDIAARRYIKTDSMARHEVQDFRDKAGLINSADDLIKNYSVGRVVLNAYGLGSLSDKPAIVRSLLTQDPDSPDSLAMKSRNPSWLSFAKEFKSWGSNGGRAAEVTTISMNGPVGSLSSSGDGGQSYSTPVVKTHGGSGQPYQMGLHWEQKGDDPLSWSVSAYAYSASTDHMVSINDGSFGVRFNQDGSLSSVTGPEGDVIDTKGERGEINFNVSDDGNADTLTLDLGTIGKSDGARLVQNIFDVPQSSVSVLSVDEQAKKITFPADLSIGTLDGSNQSYMTAPVRVMGEDSDGQGQASQVSVRWLQAGSSPPVWQAQLIDPTTGHGYSDKYAVTFDSHGTAVSAEDFTKSVTEPGKSTSVSLGDLSATINGRVYKVDLRGVSLSNVGFSAGVQDNVLNPLTSQSVSTPFNQKLIDRIANDYELNAFEGSKDNKSSGVGDALYFVRKIGDVKSITGLMSDPRLLRVAEVVSGYDPNVIGSLGFDQQMRILSKSVDLKDFSSQRSIQRYAERYLATLQNHPEYNDEDKPNTILDLFGGASGSSYDDQIISLFG